MSLILISVNLSLYIKACFICTMLSTFKFSGKYFTANFLSIYLFIFIFLFISLQTCFVRLNKISMFHFFSNDYNLTFVRLHKLSVTHFVHTANLVCYYDHRMSYNSISDFVSFSVIFFYFFFT